MHSSSGKINRSFQELSDEATSALELASFSAQMGWSRAFGWDRLLESRRVLIVSEAGAGKTYECRAEQEQLWNAGEAAFYFDLAQLSGASLNDLMLAEEEKRFGAWLASQSDVATIFLDSIDELNLTLGSFEAALRRLNKAIVGQLGRVRIVITTRPVPVDHDLIKRLLPIPDQAESRPSEETFADIAMNKRRDTDSDKKSTDSVPAWRNVALMPLSDDQIKQMAIIQGVTNADALLDDIRRRNAVDFARRPQDLIELCADWRDHRRIRTHRDQVANNIAIKLKSRTDRSEKSQLAPAKALEGASRLALAALLTRKLTVRHSVEADRGGEPGTALDPTVILSDWSDDERQTLLERALFGFASYGRVRFHHRSVIEYLAAQRLETLLERGMGMKVVKRLLFAETAQGIRVVKPSLRPVAAWLSLSQQSIFAEIREREPDVLLDHGDPESLAPQQRLDALQAYVKRYGKGGWRGMHVPRIQVHRFASNELASEVLRLWDSDIENPEVRGLLMQLIAAAPMPAGADIAYAVVMNSNADISERIDALAALIKLTDPRLEAIAQSMELKPDIWPHRFLKFAVLELFPANIPVKRLCHILKRFPEFRNHTSDFDWYWLRSIADANMAPGYLEELRAGLTSLVAEGAQWQQQSSDFVTPRRHLVAPLAAVCLRQLKEGSTSADGVRSIVAALRFSRDEYEREDAVRELRQALAQAPAPVREAVFWADDAIAQQYRYQDASWDRLFQVVYHGAISLIPSLDAAWVLANLSDATRPYEERALALEAALHGVVWDRTGEWQGYVLALKDYVTDCPALIARIEEQLKPARVSREIARMEAEYEKRKKQAKRRQAKDHASWISFWREVAGNPQTVFSPARAQNTAWNLWNAMARSGQESRASGWSRRFIEQYFSKEIADHLRATMMTIWRNDRPTLRSERPKDEKGTYLARWQLGLAAIAAEAEDPHWAHKLSAEEAKLAARYAPIELNGFPFWLEMLAAAHPAAVEAVLGPELSSELDEVASPHGSCIVLQDISHGTPLVVAIFLPRLNAWLDENHERIRKEEDRNGVSARLRQVVDVLLKHGDENTRTHIQEVATRQLGGGLDNVFATVWLPTLMKLNPAAATERLDKGLDEAERGPGGAGVDWIGRLFGDRHTESLINLRAPEFVPNLLLRLVRLAYSHVKPSEDITHEGAYSPGPRDRAQDGRNALLTALLNAQGPDGWAAKLEMAGDPLFAHFRDRALMIAREKAAEEIDGVAFIESQLIAVDHYGETSPSTRDEMYALLVDRLDNMEDSLLRDDSPRAAWAGISNEKILRREIARELRNAANHAYTVDQEGVTADEKETDIRLRATSGQQAVIELKIGDGRSGRDLRDTIKTQLVAKYMAPEVCRSGCLLVTVAESRHWEHPDSGEKLDVKGLRMMLEGEALKVVADMGATLRLTARVLDLRPRLPTEKRLSTDS